MNIDKHNCNRYGALSKDMCYQKSVELETPPSEEDNFLYHPEETNRRIERRYDNDSEYVMVDKMRSDSAMISVFKAMKCIDSSDSSSNPYNNAVGHQFTPIQVQRQPQKINRGKDSRRNIRQGYSSLNRGTSIEY